jgi:asparagine synthase (glutamine-hydrolysing)
MCGIAGLFVSKKDTQISLDHEINKMINKLKHRGPDHIGIWMDNEGLGLALANARLAIQDLSAQGNQPFLSPSGRYVLVLNGEIYNHNDLRKKILKEKKFDKWKSTSDTETLAALIDFYSIELVLNIIQGMFAFAVFDKKEKLLYLARDKVGEKPLYYVSENGKFAFASELKSLLVTNFFSKNINLFSLQEYFKFKNIPAPKTIYNNIFKLEQGKFIIFNILNFNLQIKTYWTLDKLILKNRFKKKEFFEKDILIKTEQVIQKAVEKQMIADRPVGCFLSGGIDSSLIASLMSNISKKKINTFTIGFHDSSFNEAKIAKKISKILSCEHNEYYFSDHEILDLVEKIPIAYDEPFSDSSQLPSLLISQIAKKKVTVALTGDGGDELFCGYNRYSFLINYWPVIMKMPKFLKYLIINFINIIPVKLMNHILQNFFLKKPINIFNILNKIKISLNSKDEKNLFLNLISDFNNINILSNKNIKINKNFYIEDNNLNLSSLEKFMYNDLNNYFPNDIMTKVDRSSMYYSLETRVPMMDTDVIEHAWTLTGTYNKNHGNKWILKKILEKYIPKELIYRPKTGFAVPLDNWLRGPLKNWMKHYLCEIDIRNKQILDLDIVNSMIKDHLENRKNYGHELWSLVVFQQWRKFYEV